MTRLLYGCLTVLLLATFATAERVRYDNYRVYQLAPRTAEQLSKLQDMEGSSDSYIYLDPVHSINSKINVVVAPHKVPDFLATLKAAAVPYELVEENAQSKLEYDEVADPKRRSGDYEWNAYHEIDDTYDWLESLNKKYTKEVSVFVAGESYEGRQIKGVRIAMGDSKNKSSIFIEGGMHAREWISPATSTYFIQQLLTSKDKDVRMIAEKYVWYIVPHSNPDGYAYTHKTDRLWRKTRTPYGKCYGADPNRNWDFHWNEVGSSNKACSDTYAGPSPFSEIETRTLADFISAVNKREQIFMYISFHSYSQLLLYPYGHTAELPQNNKDLVRVYDAAIKAVAQRYGTKYTGGNIYTAIYPASGASLDWAYGTLNVPYSYCYELRPSSSAFWIGFKLPAAQIIPTGEETLDGVVAMIKEAGIAQFV